MSAFAARALHLAVASACSRHPGDFAKLLEARGYDRLTPPSRDPVDVEVQFFLQSFDGVDELHESVSVTGFLRSWWTEHRVVQEDACMALSIPGDMLWMPGLYIFNSMKLTYQGDRAITLVHGNGTIFHSVAFHVSLKCAMQFHRMPYDSHGCFVEVGSWHETTESIQMRPRHGSREEYMTQTGLGLLGDRMFSPIWFIEHEDAIENPGIRTKKHWPALGGDTDIVFLPFIFERRPGYLVRMVLVPSWLFLLISYTGFFIESKQAPARTTLALLPILIMRSLQGFVFAKLPQVATSVWLTDYLLGSMIIVCYAAIHYAFVQGMLALENRGSENLERLNKVKTSAERLIEESNKQKTYVATILKNYKPVTVEGAAKASYLAAEVMDLNEEEEDRKEEAALRRRIPERPWPRAESPEEPLLGTSSVSMRALKNAELVDKHFALDVRRNLQHSPIEQREITEGDLGVIEYLLSLWEEEVPPGQTATPEMIRRVMTSFNIYMSARDAQDIMCAFLRDKGFDTLECENEVRIIFSLFMELLLKIDTYKVRVRRPRFFEVPFSRAVPGSQRLDAIMQFVFPVVVIMHTLVMFALIQAYPQNPDVGLVADMKSVMQWQ